MKLQYRTGISSGILADKTALEKLLVFEPEVIEFYNYSTTETELIRQFCRHHQVRPSLHTPVPYDEPEPLRRFCPTGPSHWETELAIRLTLDTIRLAADLDATGVVVHFPSPYPDAFAPVTHQQLRFFFDPVASLADQLQVKLLIENMTPHPTFHTPQDYLGILQEYPHLGICFDAGHAFMLQGNQTVHEFLDVLGPHIGSVHLYGLVKKGESFERSFLQPPDGSQSLDVPAVISRIKTLQATPVCILEYPACGEARLPDAVASMSYLRSLLSQGA